MKLIIVLFLCFEILHYSLVQGANCSQNRTDIFSSFTGKNYNYAIFGTLLILNVLILIGNPATILVIIFKEKKPYDILILGLAVFDTLTGVIPLPITNYNYYYYLFVNQTEVEQPGTEFITGGKIGCTLYGWSALTFKSGSMLILAIIPFERLLAINFPFWYKKNVKLWKMGIVLIIAIIFSAAHSAVPAIPGLGRIKAYGVQKSYCHFEYDDPNNIGSVAYSYFVQIYGYGLVLVASACYVLLICSIVVFLMRRRKYIARSEEELSRKKQRELLLSLKFLLIIVLFNFGWLPFLVSITYRFIFPHCSSPNENVHSVLEFLGVRIAVLNSVINPVVYVLLMQSYRRGYRVLVGTCCFWISCRKFASLKPNRYNKEEYLSKSIHHKSKELQKTISFHSEFSKYKHGQRSLNNSRENVSLIRQESLLASPRYADSACNSGKNSLTSLQPTDIGGIFQYIPGRRSDVVSYAIRELEEPSAMDEVHAMENIIPESVSAYTLASESTIQNSTLPRDANRDDVITPLSGGPWSYSFYINGAALDRSNQSLDKTSEYSGIPGYSYVDMENNAELKNVLSNSLKRNFNKDSLEGEMSDSKDSGLLDLERLGLDRGVDVEMFANQSVEQQDRPTRISSTAPHSYKPYSVYPDGKEIYPKRKLKRTTAHDFRVEARTPPHLRILQYEARSQRRAVARGLSNPLEPLREVRNPRVVLTGFNIHNSSSVPLRLSELHSLKLSQSNSQLNKASKASLSPQSSNCVLSPTNISVLSGDTGYASSRVTASGVTRHPKFKRNNSLRQSFRDALGGFANNMKKRVSKSKSSSDFQLQNAEDV